MCPPDAIPEGGAATLPPHERLTAAVRAVPDFPRPGIVFRDITTVIRDADLFHESVDAMVAACSGLGIDVVVGIEARGFIFGGALAYLLGAGFVPVRKQGRLPTRTETASYTLEYGEAVLEVHADAITTGQRVVIVDDLLATGGTASATIALVERLGGTVARLVFLIELAGLGGAAALNGRNHVSLITI